jgi:hypothetical protein
MPALMLRGQLVLLSVLRALREGYLAFKNLLAQLTIPPGVTFSDTFIKPEVR